MNMRHYFSNYWSLIIVIALSPILLTAVLPILPTHDDWTSLTTPSFGEFFTKERFFFYGYHWRPFDSMIGYVAGRNPQTLFPAFNHVIVIIGHLICTLAVFKLLSTLHFSRLATNITTLLFFILPATMASVTAVDSQNQVLALTCDIIAFLAYIHLKKWRYPVWILLILLATLFKENGLMWAIICPILAFGFGFIDRRRLQRDMIAGFSIILLYALFIIVQPKDITIHPDYEPGIMKMVSNTIKFFFTTFITVDYIYLLHRPSRNLPLALLTLLTTLPFLYFLFMRKGRRLINKPVLATLLAMLIAVSPHVFTVFSMMHTYAALGLLAVLMAYAIDSIDKMAMKPVLLTALAFAITSLAIDIHLINSSIDSGRIGKQMAVEAIQKTGEPVSRVQVIIIEDDYPKISSFCVIPAEAFGWGIAAKYETNYCWPQEICDTTIERTDSAPLIAQNLAKTYLQSDSCDCVWIINHSNVDVVK